MTFQQLRIPLVASRRFPPAGAIRDRNDNPIVDRNGNYILARAN